MQNKYKVVISNRSIYKEIELMPGVNSISAGTDADCEIRLRRDLFFEPVGLRFVRNGEQWSVVCSDNLYIDVGDIRKLLTKQLTHGDSFAVRYQSSNIELFSMEFMVDFDNGQRRYERMIDISQLQTVRIGADGSNQIIIRSAFIDNDQIELRHTHSGSILNILRTRFGVFLNGSKISGGSCTLANGDFFSVSDFIFYVKDGLLWTEIRDGLIVNGLTFTDFVLPDGYPKFSRNTRVKTVLNDTEIEILDPPAKPEKPKSNIILKLLPSLGMLLMAGVMALMGGTTMLIFSGVSGGIAIITTVATLIEDKRQYKKKCEERIEKYNAYIERKRAEIAGCRQEEQRTLESIYIPQQEEQTRLYSFSPDLFDRSKDDDDFLCVRLGSGNVKSNRKVNYKKQEKLEIEDDLQEMPGKICDEFQNVVNAPIVCDLKLANAIGVIGQEAFRFEMMKNIVLDIAARHYYTDVKMFFVVDKSHSDSIRWLRMLPHVYNEDIGIRNIVCDDESRNIIFEYLYKELTYREQQKSFDSQLVVFFYDDYGIKSHPVSKFVEKATELGVTFVFFGDTRGDISSGCRYLIEIHDQRSGTLTDAEDSSTATLFSYPVITTPEMAGMVDLLAPVYTEEVSLESSLTKNISMFEMLNIYAVDDIDLKKRWAGTQVFKSMAAPVGVSKTGIVSLDLHDKAHGPHGLVAGTTGSGKSELLQTYVLSMATLYHPYEVGFVIIDFKGGGMVNQFRDLPHLVGAITNIDGKAIDRSLKSIKAELQKRQRLFAEADVNHIDKYIKKYKAGEVSAPLPHLIIIVDEFAELKAEQPEFMKELISAARIGRSLGVHLILATQKPSGQVNEQIWSNSRFKLCLKVQSQSDSNEVIKSPLAAEIKEPGRAYLQVGNNEIFELFQSAYSGAPEKSDDTNVKEFTIYNLSDSGKRIPVFSQKKKKGSADSATQLDAIVRHVADYCRSAGIQKLPDICLPALGDYIEYDNVKIDEFSVPIGIYDDPDNQLQDTFGVNLFTDNTIILGSSMTGKTNMLQLIIKGIAYNYSPQEVSIYIIDFASMVLKNFEKLNHVGGVVIPNESEKLGNLFKLLNTEIQSRREKLLLAGVSNFIAYKEAGNTDLPQIVLIVDNLTSLRELYFAEDDMLLPILRDGLSVGVSVIIANQQSAGIGYRYFSSIEQRIGFYCNDATEYHSLFDHCRIQPENTPGRCLIQLDKEIYEAQTYISFTGEKEFERVQEISKFIEKINAEKRNKAKRIPVIPDMLVENLLSTEFGVQSDKNKLIIGLDFANVTPVSLNYSKQDVLAVAGGITESKNAFVTFIKKSIMQLGTETYVLDDYSEMFGDVSENESVSLYSRNVEDITEMLVSFRAVLVERYAERELKGASAIDKLPPIVLIINANDAVKYISENRNALEVYKDIVKKYKKLRSLIIFTNLENEAISYNSPEVLKMMKENYQLIVFDNINDIKLFDVPLSVTKKFKLPLKDNEAYFLSGNVLKKIKTIIKR